MDNLKKLIQNFIISSDRNTGNADLIVEQIYKLNLDEDELFDELISRLSQYQPGGGDYLYSDESILPYIKHVYKEHFGEEL